MFKVSKQPYRSARHDVIIFRWRHCLHGGQKRNLKNYTISSFLNISYSEVMKISHTILVFFVSICRAKFVAIYYKIFLNIRCSKTTVLLLRSSSSVPPELLHAPGSAYIFWNNGRIFMFKVSKRLYRSARRDGIIFRWHHKPPGGDKWN